ncbi:hypothetical protein ASAP_3024 [Asaia bogorensis]|uniref:Uncharacterized protein n=1 Tax=Asaia bogorensis TaxID=91915 RepID=A0A060QIS0_9PROT|nr:hypothetical protein ASAP_3024 [Asaia bogorensis]
MRNTAACDRPDIDRQVNPILIRCLGDLAHFGNVAFIKRNQQTV